MVGSDKRLAPTTALHSNQMIGCGLAQFLFLTRRASSVIFKFQSVAFPVNASPITTRSPKTKSKPDILSHGHLEVFGETAPLPKQETSTKFKQLFVGTHGALSRSEWRHHRDNLTNEFSIP